MIPREITEQDIIKAIRFTAASGYPSNRNSYSWDLEYEGSLFPPKFIISKAALFSTYGKEYDPNIFQATEARSFLKARGFNIIPRNSVSDVNVIDDIPSNKETTKANLDIALAILDSKKIPATRIEKIVEQSIRNDTRLIKFLKKLYKYKCQMPGCEAEIKKKNGGLYCEVAHITPFSEVQCSAADNLIVLCPNHHKEFDLGDVKIHSRKGKVVKGKINGRDFKFELLT